MTPRAKLNEDLSPKPKVESKTLWINGVGTVLAALAPFAEQAIQLMPKEGWWSLASAFLANVFLRLKTKRPLL